MADAEPSSLELLEHPFKECKKKRPDVCPQRPLMLPSVFILALLFTLLRILIQVLKNVMRSRLDQRMSTDKHSMTIRLMERYLKRVTWITKSSSHRNVSCFAPLMVTENLGCFITGAPHHPSPKLRLECAKELLLTTWGTGQVAFLRRPPFLEMRTAFGTLKKLTASLSFSPSQLQPSHQAFHYLDLTQTLYWLPSSNWPRS